MADLGRGADVASRGKNCRIAILWDDRVALIRLVCWLGVVHLRDRASMTEVVVGRDYGRANEGIRRMIDYSRMGAIVMCILRLSADIGHLRAVIGLRVLWISTRSWDCSSKTTRIASSAELMDIVVERKKTAATVAGSAGPRARPMWDSRRVHDENLGSEVE